MPLLDDDQLERSAVVANCRMNRERRLAGSNGYGRELGFDPVAFLAGRVAERGRAAWLDVCCGSGLAMVEARRVADARGWGDRLAIVGVDLVGMFAAPDPLPAGLELVAASARVWEPGRRFDLVTCVHGLHYVGDKLGLIARMASWLEPGGRFAANFDTGSVRSASAGEWTRTLLGDFRRADLGFDRRRRLLTGNGPLASPLPYRYLGADDSAGPNYTGQPAVNSHYERIAASPD